MDTLVEGAGREVTTIRTESHTIDRLRMPLQCLPTRSRSHIPKTHCRVETRTIKESTDSERDGSEIVQENKLIDRNLTELKVTDCEDTLSVFHVTNDHSDTR